MSGVTMGDPGQGRGAGQFGGGGRDGRRDQGDDHPGRGTDPQHDWSQDVNFFSVASVLG